MGCGSSVASDVSPSFPSSCSDNSLTLVTNPTGAEKSVPHTVKPSRQRKSIVVFLDQPEESQQDAERRHKELLRQDSDISIHSVHSSCLQEHLLSQHPPKGSPGTGIKTPIVRLLPCFAELPDATCSLCHQWCDERTAVAVVAETSFGEHVESMGPSLTPSRRSSVTMHWPSDSENNLGGCVLSSMERMDAEIAALEAELRALEAEETESL